MVKVNIKSLVADLEKEGGQAAPAEVEKTASLSEALGGQEAKTEPSEIEKIASDLSEEVGFEVELSAELEKVASDMSDATSVDDIIKIAQESGNEDLANIAMIADSFADVIVARVEDQLLKG